jgi:hypothetical protein
VDAREEERACDDEGDALWDAFKPRGKGGVVGPSIRVRTRWTVRSAGAWTVGWGSGVDDPWEGLLGQSGSRKQSRAGIGFSLRHCLVL